MKNHGDSDKTRRIPSEKADAPTIENPPSIGQLQMVGEGFERSTATDGGERNGAPPARSASERDEPSQEQWAQLYDIAGKINRLAPWDFLYDTDLVTIMLPGREEPVFCSVMGRAGACFGIGVYPGFEAIMSYYRLLEAPEGELAYMASFDQICLTCYFGDREEVTPRDREIFKSLGLRFRGRNQWIYFRAMEPGFIPWHITSEQADLLAKTLENLYMACGHLAEGKVEVDFEGGETLLRFYSPEGKQWFNAAERMPRIPVVRRRLIIDDALLLARMKKQKKTDREIEFDMLYMPMPVQERQGDRPYLPRLLVLADKQSGVIIDQHMAEPNEDFAQPLTGMIAGHIAEHGRPAAIHVRDDRTRLCVEDLCKKIGVKVADGKGMPVIDGFLKGLMDYMG